MREVALLISVLSPLFFIAGGFWTVYQGWASLPAFVWTAGVCLFFGAMALLVQEMAFRRDAELAGSLSTVLFRTLGPMLSAIILTHWNPDLLKHQIFPAFVGCYLLTLTTETILSVCLIQRWEKLRTERVSPATPANSNLIKNND